MSDATTSKRLIDGIEVTTMATTYTLNAAGNHRDAELWDVNVEWVGNRRFHQPLPTDRQWAIRLRSHWCLSTTWSWDSEPRPSEREDDWLDTHRFDLETALDMAARIAPTIEINGQTAAAIAAQQAARRQT